MLADNFRVKNVLLTMKTTIIALISALFITGCATQKPSPPPPDWPIKYQLKSLKAPKYSLTMPDGTVPVFDYYLGGRSSGACDSLLWVNSLFNPTNTNLTNIISTVTNYVGDYYIIWTSHGLPSPFTAVGIQASNDQVNWLYYPDTTNYFKITPDQYGNLGMAFGSDDPMDAWFFRGIPE